MAQTEVFGQTDNECPTVICPDLTALLEFDNVPPDLPIGVRNVGVDGLHCLDAPLCVGFGNLLQQMPVTRIGTQPHINPIFFRCPSTRAASVSTSPASLGSGVA